MPEGRRPRAVTPCPRSGAETGSTPCPKGGGQEELPNFRVQGQRLRVPGCDGVGTTERSYPNLRLGAVAGRNYPRARGQGRLRGATLHPRSGRRLAGATPYPRLGAAAGSTNPMPEARGGRREELPGFRGQGRQPRGATPRPRGATPRPRSGAAAERSYPASKVRGGGLEELPQVRG